MAVCPALTALIGGLGGVVVREKSEKKMFKVTAAVWDAAVPVTVMLKGLGEFAESEFTFTMLVCPPLIEEGLNEQVTPPPELQLSAIKEVKELGVKDYLLKAQFSVDELVSRISKYAPLRPAA